MARTLLFAGAGLVLLGVGVVVGYWLYFSFKLLFAVGFIPMAIKVAIPAVLAGVLLLIASILWERLKSRKERKAEEERLREVKY